MLVRVQSPAGTVRLQVQPQDTTASLYEKVFEQLSLTSFSFVLSKERSAQAAPAGEIVSSKSRSLQECGLGHGDMLYLTPLNGAVLFDQSTTGDSLQKITKNLGETQVSSDPGPSTSGMNDGGSSTAEDEVDIILYQKDGKVARQRDEKYCRHNVNGRCVHCSPLEPFDEAYLKEQNIKHMSFHTYLKKCMSGVGKGKFLALEDISCKIKSGCKEHPPWPRGICSKCQPNAITLNRQTYRHVDNVMFENGNIVERFLDCWRSTAHQRIGFLYGKYELHTDVPLGIRARVAAIYEPPQECTKDGVSLLLPDERRPIVDEVAGKLGLVEVGWIFTDLLSEDSSKGTVQYLRGIETHFLTAQECIMAGYFQNRHPNLCKYASSGTFGSKFATVCVTGDASKQVHMEGYQVTNQCMALVRDDCLLPTLDAPELGYVKESSNKQYVPDVYYKEKDQYGNEVARIARPLPVEYLLLDVPCATPRVPLATFTRTPPRGEYFPVENRRTDPQTLRSLALYLARWPDERFLEAVSDFHVLLYIATMDAFPMLTHMDDLFKAVVDKDEELATRWKCSEQWATVGHLLEASEHSQHIDADMAGGSGIGGENGALWTCPYCTYHNQPHRDTCEICILPRSAV